VSEESSHPRGILDTSTVILLEKLVDAKALPAEPLITAVTLAELSVGPLVAKAESERAGRQTQLQQAEADFKPLPFDADAARAFGSVVASLRRAGRKTTARTYDAMIAATAVANNLPVYTCNPTDFSGIDRLEVIPVPVPDDPPTPSAPMQTTRETTHDPENPQQPG
jgi:tRNA(fMet)-specific endonuclease VapC